MEYSDVSKKIRKYIKKSTYVEMSPNERSMYLMSATNLMHESDKSVDEIKNSLQEFNIKEHDDGEIKRKLNFRNIKFVGMRFFGDHIFMPSDDIMLVVDYSAHYKLKQESIKVMLRKSKRYKQVAYVERGDATWLRSIPGFERLSLEFISANSAKAFYRIDLRPLENEGVKILPKIAVLGKLKVNSYYLYDELWHNYPDLDYCWTLPRSED
jgi:hypothetical protein